MREERGEDERPGYIQRRFIQHNTINEKNIVLEMLINHYEYLKCSDDVDDYLN